MLVKMEPSLTIEDAKHLMEVLDNDIPSWDKKNIALLLLILASNPDLAENGSPVGYSPRSYHGGHYADDYGSEYYGYGC